MEAAFGVTPGTRVEACRAPVDAGLSADSADSFIASAACASAASAAAKAVLVARTLTKTTTVIAQTFTANLVSSTAVAFVCTGTAAAASAALVLVSAAGTCALAVVTAVSADQVLTPVATAFHTLAVHAAVTAPARAEHAATTCDQACIGEMDGAWTWTVRTRLACPAARNLLCLAAIAHAFTVNRAAPARPFAESLTSAA